MTAHPTIIQQSLRDFDRDQTGSFMPRTMEKEFYIGTPASSQVIVLSVDPKKDAEIQNLKEEIEDLRNKIASLSQNRDHDKGVVAISASDVDFGELDSFLESSSGFSYAEVTEV